MHSPWSTASGTYGLQLKVPSSSHVLQNFASLLAIGEIVKNQLHGKHQSENGEAENPSFSEVTGVNAGKNAHGHDYRTDRSERAECKNAGGAAQVGRRHQPQSEAEQDHGGVGKKNP